MPIEATNAVKDALARLGESATCTTEQLAAAMGCPPDTLWRAVRMGKAPFPFIRVGRSIRWITGPIIRTLSGVGGSS